MEKSSLHKTALALVIAAGFACFAPKPALAADAPAISADEAIARIKKEGMSNSQAMTTLSYLSDVIGERLTGSPSLKRANEWTKSKLTEWGLSNAHLESWGPFGRGWELKHFSAQVTEPLDYPVIACPNAWTPGLSKTLKADVVYMGNVGTSNLESYKGQLAGKIVLISPMRELFPRTEPIFTRQTESNLTRLAEMTGNADRPQRIRGGTNRFGGGTNRFGGGPGGRFGGADRMRGPRLLAFLMKEKVGLVISESSQGDGGTIFVSQASVPSTNTNTTAGFGPGPAGPRPPSYYSLNAPPMPPQITMAAEDYNRLVRMTQFGVTPKMEVDLKVKYYTDDPMAYNTIAEIPGTDLKDQIVMLGGHMDSWQSGTGATDNGVGVAAAMEAVRIIKAAGLQPRRTIRIALWSGEEEGLLGSRAYVSNHFGNYGTNAPRNRGFRRPPSDDDTNTVAEPPPPKLIKGPEFDKLSVYFNLDNGAGKIRGIYMQGDSATKPIFTKWFEPFHEDGAETITASNTGSTDHVSFDDIGLPGFQFIQDPLDYSTRTHHSNQDVFDRIQADDLKQASTIMAAFVYNAAMMDEKFPRKSAETD